MQSLATPSVAELSESDIVLEVSIWVLVCGMFIYVWTKIFFTELNFFFAVQILRTVCIRLGPVKVCNRRSAKRRFCSKKSYRYMSQLRPNFVRSGSI